MAIIDGKGRVFGKINIIDLMVILFIILVIAVGAKFALFKPAPEETKVTVEVLFKDTKPWVAKVISNGDTEVNDDNRIISKIKEIQAAPSAMIISSDTGEIYIREHPELKDVKVIFDIIAEKKESSLLFHNKDIKIGKNFSFSTDKYDISGTIISIS